MKKNYSLLIICFLLFTSIISLAIEKNNCQSQPIDLYGTLHQQKQRSIITPIQAYLSNQLIEVNISSLLGEIEVIIFDENLNNVYNKSVDTNSVQQIFINISSFEEGIYTIEFVNSRNEYLSGSFEI